MTEPALSAVGELMVDVSVRGPGGHEAEVRLGPGGSAANAAGWAAACGARATVIGRVGADPAGRMLRAELLGRGVEARLAVDERARTGTFLAFSRDGEIVADRGANARLEPSDLPARIEADAVLVSGHVLLRDGSAPAGRAALERARAVWIAVDVGSAGLVSEGGLELVRERARGASVLLANEAEARALTGAEAEEAARVLGGAFRLACVKRGAKGAVAVLDGRVASATAPRVAVVDGAGAGDAFAAGLLVALARGRELAAALGEGCRCGALAAGPGGPWPAAGRP